MEARPSRNTTASLTKRTGQLEGFSGRGQCPGRLVRVPLSGAVCALPFDRRRGEWQGRERAVWQTYR